MHGFMGHQVLYYWYTNSSSNTQVPTLYLGPYCSEDLVLTQNTKIVWDNYDILEEKYNFKSLFYYESL